MALDFLLPSITMDGKNDFCIDLTKTEGNKLATLHQLKRSIHQSYHLVIESGDEIKVVDLPYTQKVFELNFPLADHHFTRISIRGAEPEDRFQLYFLLKTYAAKISLAH